MIKVDKSHFLHAALEIGQSGENDTLPYDIDAKFIKERSDELAEICFTLFCDIESGKVEKPIRFMNGLAIAAERLLVPSGSHGFRITTKIDPFWNLYLNGLGLAVAQANEGNRGSRVHSYRLSSRSPDFFDRARSWRSYKEATLKESALADDQAVVVQTDIASFYEHIYHHRLENVVRDLAESGSTIALQISRILSQLAAGRSFGLPVGGQCARVLAEVMMTPIDQSISDAGLTWHRYVDDFTLICRSQQDAYRALSALSHALADYGLSLNRSKTTFLSGKHYVNFISTELGVGNDAGSALREMDLHFDPYSDNARDDYDKLKQSFDQIDISFLLDLEIEKSEPDMFIIAQIGRALQFQDSTTAEQLCSTLLSPKNLDSFRASWSKIMRGVYAVRSRPDFETIFPALDAMLDRLPGSTPHLLVPEANLLHFLRAIRFVRTETRGSFVRQTFDNTSSSAVRRACIDCWRYWRDRPSFNRLRNQWANLRPNEQRMAWLAAGAFNDEGAKARDQLRASLAQSWSLGFETENSLSFAACYESWAKNAA
jgi:Reverse transcriptase (RNA-dependent DNA polymerase)